MHVHASPISKQRLLTIYFFGAFEDGHSSYLARAFRYTGSGWKGGWIQCAARCIGLVNTVFTRMGWFFSFFLWFDILARRRVPRHFHYLSLIFTCTLCYDDVRMFSPIYEVTEAYLGAAKHGAAHGMVWWPKLPSRRSGRADSAIGPT